MTSATPAERGAWERDDVRLLEQRRGERRRIGAAVDAHEPEEGSVRWRPVHLRNRSDTVEQRRTPFQKILMKRFGIAPVLAHGSERRHLRDDWRTDDHRVLNLD